MSVVVVIILHKQARKLNNEDAMEEVDKPCPMTRMGVSG